MNQAGGKRRDCLHFLAIILIVCAAITFYPFLWIPAIGGIIYFFIKKDLIGRKKKLLVTGTVFITSLLVWI